MSQSTDPQTNNSGCLGCLTLLFLGYLVYAMVYNCTPKQDGELYSTWRCWKSLDGKWETLDYGYPRSKPGGSDSDCVPVK